MSLKHILHLSILFTVVFGYSVSAEKIPGPLDRPDAYSLYVNEQGWDYPNHFPLGILGPRDRNELIHYGFDYTEIQQEAFYFMENGVGAPPMPFDNTLLGLYVTAWSQHTLYHIKDVKGYGKTPNALKYDGTPQPAHEVSIYNPIAQKFILDADTALAKSWGQTARPIMMWGLDNELEGYLDYSPEARTAFVEWLKKTYPSIDELNKTWDSAYKNYSEATPPDAEPRVSRPAAWLDWHAFLDNDWTLFTAARYKAIYDNDPLHRPVAMKATQCSYDMPTQVKQRTLDPGMHADLTRKYGGWYGVDMYGADDRLAYEANFAYQCIRPLDVTKGGKVLLPEVNNHSGPGWQWANTMWRVLGNGTKAIDFFCFGSIGATSDWEIYGMTSPDGNLKSKMVYAARFANSVRRTESFWARSIPAQNVPRAAILLPRRDVLLADNPDGSPWDPGNNNRYKVYAQLRDCGMWTDIIPYTKLNAEFLKQYSVLVLVDAKHLMKPECSQIAEYIKNGGVLIGDSMSGHYDEHHRVTKGLEDVFGVDVSSYDNVADVWVNTKKGILRGDFLAVCKPTTAKFMSRTTREQPLVMVNHFGKGTAMYVTTPMGVLRNDTPGDDLVASWIDSLLKMVNIKPSYRDSKGLMPGSLRLECPWVDDNGNMGLILANRVENAHAKTSLDITLPDGKWSHAYWAPAENLELKPVKLRMIKNICRINLPEFKTAGMILFINENRPLISISIPKTKKTGVDGYLPVLIPLKEQNIRVTLVNPGSKTIPAGILKIKALPGWKLSASNVKTARLGPGASCDIQVGITAPDTGILHFRERMYPVNFRWSNGRTDQSVCSALVGVDVDESKLPKLLSNNTGYPDNSPRKIKTGATYKYLFDEKAMSAYFGDLCTAQGRNGNALQNGSGGWEKLAIYNQGKFPIIPIEFDLKDIYPLEMVRLQMGPPGYPDGMEVLVSTDGKTFTSAGTAKVDGPPAGAKWIELTDMKRCQARYVRINVNMAHGGYLDEVEIWGYEKG